MASVQVPILDIARKQLWVSHQLRAYFNGERSPVTEETATTKNLGQCRKLESWIRKVTDVMTVRGEAGWAMFVADH